MATFTPPSTTTVPPVLPEGDPEQSGVAFRLFRYFRARPEGINVYRYRSGSPMALAEGEISENDPYAIYDDEGLVASNGWDDVVTVYWGSCTFTVDATEQALLEGAGYTVT